MSKSIKFNNNVYLDCSGIMYKRNNLEEYLDNLIKAYDESIKKCTDAINEILIPYVLYEHVPEATDVITLSDSAINYKYFEVFYRYSTNTACMSERIYSPNDKKVMLNGSYDNGTYLYICTCDYTISENKMTRGDEIRWRIATNGGKSTRTASTANLQIYRVIGYK